MLRFGILGFGHHGVYRLVPAFPGSRSCALQGIWRRNAAKAQENARTLGIPQVFATAEELCSSPDIDAVFVTSPDSRHMEDSLLAIHHGKSVLCEKPLAMSAAQVETMITAAQAAGVTFGVAQNFRYNSSVAQARAWIAEGRIGQPQIAHVQFCYSAEGSPRDWIYDPALAFGGPIGDVGVHCVDAMRFILQDDVVAVSTIARRDALSGEVESSAVLALELAKGTVATVTVTTRAEYRSLFDIAGESGTITCDHGLTVDRPVELLLKQKGQVVASETHSNADAYTRMLDSFADAVAGKGAYLATGEDGLRNQQILDAAYQSWRTGTRQTLSAS